MSGLSGVKISLAAVLAAVLASQACSENAFEVRQAGSASVLASTGAELDPSRGVVASMSSWDDPFPQPVLAEDCLVNPLYNLCLAYKDPVSTYGSAFSPPFTPTTGTRDQESRVFVYGVRVPATVPQNEHMVVYVEAPLDLVEPTSAGDWKHSYLGDSNHNVAQIQSWYWLNRTRTYFTERTGTFHATGENAKRKLEFWPIEKDVENQAFFISSTYSIHIGHSTVNQGHGKADLALDMSIASHEMGHANFYMASPNSMNISSATTVSCLNDTYCCRTTSGCTAAIHEGVGDLHAVFLHPNRGGGTGAYFFNNVGGIRDRNLDAIRASGMRAQDFYARTTGGEGRGQIHNLGSVYASIWYGVWLKAKAMGQEREIETLFIEHLTGLGASDTFLTAYSTISAMAVEIFPAKAEQIKADFKVEYTRMGLNVN